MKIAGLTHIGNVRSVNEDTLLIHCEEAPRYLLVADGMGGHAAGDVASAMAAECIREYIAGVGKDSLTRDKIGKAIEFANDRLLREMEQDERLQGMGTTLTFAHPHGSSILIAQVGDSGAYLYNGELTKITKDHTYVQHLIDSGVIKGSAQNEYPFRNIITRALGMKKLEVDFYDVQWQDGETLLICSDGLSTYVDTERMAEVLATDMPVEKQAQRLVSEALEAGGKDNITVIIAKNDPQEDRMA